jgi:hypothetical protein
MLSLKIKTIDFIELINSNIIEISVSDLEDLKSKIKIIPDQNRNEFKVSDDCFSEEFKKVFSNYSVLFQLT